MSDDQSLRDAATKATPGPWLVDQSNDGVYSRHSNPNLAEMPTEVCGPPSYIHGWENESNREYIAACDPQTVLSLLDRIRDLELDAEAANGLIISGLEVARRLDAAKRVIDLGEQYYNGDGPEVPDDLHETYDGPPFGEHTQNCEGCRLERVTENKYLAALAEYREMSKP